MSTVNQDIRFAKKGNANNPEALYEFIKPTRWIFDASNPDMEVGENEWFYVNTVTADVFEKFEGQWNLVYNFNTGGGSGGFTNIESDGLESIVKTPIGATIHLKGIGEGAPNQINIDPSDPDSLLLSMKSNYKPDLLQFIADNTALSAGFGSGSFSPDTVLGDGDGFPTGSMFVQLPSYTVWVCSNGASSTWQIHESSSGIQSNNNLGAGFGVFKNTISGVANFKTFATSTNTELIILPDTLAYKVSDSYIPILLDQVKNIKDNREAPPSAPLMTDDDSKGYVKGSLYYEFEPSNTIKMWACVNPQTGAAQWVEVSNIRPTIQKATFYGLTSSGQTFVDLNYNPLLIGPTPMPIYQPGSANWSSVWTGATLIFRRGASTSGNYLVTVYLSVSDAAGPTLATSIYNIRMLSAGIPVNGSNMTISLNASPAASRSGSASVSFITQFTSGQNDRFFEIRGFTGASPAPTLIYDEMTVTFTEV